MMPITASAFLVSIVLLVATSSTATVTAPDLGTSVNFTVHAHDTVTNTGATTIGGYIGVGPGTAMTGIEGLVNYYPTPVNSGRVSQEDANTTHFDVEDAYLDAAGRVEDVQPISVVNIGGVTYTAGLYNTAGALEVSTDSLYLSGPGVFIFQCNSLLMGPGRQMFLVNGAKASNVFWQVSDSVKLDTTSEAVGTIIAQKLIALLTGAKIEGRLLSVNGAVTLQGNDIVFPGQKGEE